MLNVALKSIIPLIDGKQQVIQDQLKDAVLPSLLNTLTKFASSLEPSPGGGPPVPASIDSDAIERVLDVVDVFEKAIVLVGPHIATTNQDEKSPLHAVFQLLPTLLSHPRASIQKRALNLLATVTNAARLLDTSPSSALPAVAERFLQRTLQSLQHALGDEDQSLAVIQIQILTVLIKSAPQSSSICRKYVEIFPMLRQALNLENQSEDQTLREKVHVVRAVFCGSR